MNIDKQTMQINPIVPVCALHVVRTLALLGSVGLGASYGAEPLHYDLAFQKPNTHLLDVRIRGAVENRASIELAMPAWAPGSYVIRNFAENVQSFKAFTADGLSLPWHKTDSQSWKVDLRGSREVRIQYQVYYENYNDRHVMLLGPSVWMYVVNCKEEPISLTIDRTGLPENWKVATGLTPVRDLSFTASDYDTFTDSPIEISEHGERIFETHGVRYHLISDPRDEIGFDQFAADLKKVIDVTVPLLAPTSDAGPAAPFQDYYFLMHGVPGLAFPAGGQEHLNSTVMSVRSGWSDRAKMPGDMLEDVYVGKLFVTIHECFHAWNGKRLRPRELGPFDYSKMVHTPSLWISEGLTNYYAALALRRAGFLSESQYLKYIGRVFSSLEEKPGRNERSIAETSWDVWLRGAPSNDGVPSHNLINTTYSFYDGGHVIGLILDLEIRHATANRKCLDDWMRVLYSRYALPNPGFDPEDAQNAASEIAGKDMTEFFQKYVFGREPIPYERVLSYAGISLETMPRTAAWIGATLSTDSAGRAMVAHFTPGSPAERAGLDRRDSIVAVAGKLVDRASFEKEIVSRRTGDSIELMINRRGRGNLQPVTMTVGASPFVDYVLHPPKQPTDLQRSIYEGFVSVSGAQ